MTAHTSSAEPIELAELGATALSARVRLVPLRQLTATGCGATCLRMVLAHHGCHVSSGEMDAAAAVGRDGVSALQLLQVGERYGLVGRGVKLPASAVGSLKAGAILHFRQRHFVVLERVESLTSGLRITVLDPALGRCRLSLEDFAEEFSGLALELGPGAEFRARERPAHPLLRFVPLLLEQRRSLSSALLLSFFVLVLSLSVPLMTMLVIDWLIPSGSFDNLLWVSLGFVVLALGQAAVSVARSVVLVDVHDRIDRVMSQQLFEQLLSLPIAFFTRRSVGDLMSRITNLSQVRDALTRGATTAVLDGFLVIAYLLLLGWMSTTMLLATVLLTALQLLHFLACQKRLSALHGDYLRTEADARGYQTRMLMGVEVLKASGAERAATEHCMHLVDESLRACRARGRFLGVFEGTGAGLRLLGPLLVLALCAAEVLSGNLGLGMALGAAQVTLAFLAPTAALLQTAMDVRLALGYVERLDEIYATPSERCESGTQPPTLEAGISFHDVCFRYSPGGPWVLDHVSLTLRAGQRVAIMGASGSGKSTLMKALLGMVQPERGSIRLGGVAQPDIDVQAFRRQVGVVTQDAPLFDMTVAENIALGSPGASREAIEQAARTAQVHAEIVALPMGYDTRLTDGGAGLSGGQRQRVALARALVRKPRLLLLDEATSALDAITEHAIQDAVAGLDCAVVSIAHRLSTVRGADLVIVMRDGRVVEQGAPEQLMTRDGPFRALLDTQLTGA